MQPQHVEYLMKGRLTHHETIRKTNSGQINTSASHGPQSPHLIEPMTSRIEDREKYDKSVKPPKFRTVRSFGPIVEANNKKCSVQDISASNESNSASRKDDKNFVNPGSIELYPPQVHPSYPDKMQSCCKMSEDCYNYTESSDVAAYTKYSNDVSNLLRRPSRSFSKKNFMSGAETVHISPRSIDSQNEDHLSHTHREQNISSPQCPHVYSFMPQDQVTSPSYPSGKYAIELSPALDYSASEQRFTNEDQKDISMTHYTYGAIHDYDQNSEASMVLSFQNDSKSFEDDKSKSKAKKAKSNGSKHKFKQVQKKIPSTSRKKSLSSKARKAIVATLTASNEEKFDPFTIEEFDYQSPHFLDEPKSSTHRQIPDLVQKGSIAAQLQSCLTMEQYQPVATHRVPDMDFLMSLSHEKISCSRKSSADPTLETSFDTFWSTQEKVKTPLDKLKKFMPKPTPQHSYDRNFLGIQNSPVRGLASPTSKGNSLKHVPYSGQKGPPYPSSISTDETTISKYLEQKLSNVSRASPVCLDSQSSQVIRTLRRQVSSESTQESESKNENRTLPRKLESELTHPHQVRHQAPVEPNKLDYNMAVKKFLYTPQAKPKRRQSYTSPTSKKKKDDTNTIDLAPDALRIFRGKAIPMTEVPNVSSDANLCSIEAIQFDSVTQANVADKACDQTTKPYESPTDGKGASSEIGSFVFSRIQVPESARDTPKNSSGLSRRESVRYKAQEMYMKRNNNIRSMLDRAKLMNAEETKRLDADQSKDIVEYQDFVKSLNKHLENMNDSTQDDTPTYDKLILDSIDQFFQQYELDTTDDMKNPDPLFAYLIRTFLFPRLITKSIHRILSHNVDWLKLYMKENDQNLSKYYELVYKLNQKQA